MDFKNSELLRYSNGLGDNVAVWMHISNLEGQVVFWNNTAESLTGIVQEEVLTLEREQKGQIWKRLFKDEKHLRQMVDLSREVVESNIVVSGLVIPVVSVDGTLRMISWHSNNLKDKQGQVIGSLTLGLDISKQHQAMSVIEENKQRLRGLALKLSLTEEMERKKVAMDLHDTVSQRLAVSRMKLGLLNNNSSLDDEAKKLVKQTNADLEKVMDDIQRLTFELSSPLLFDGGMRAALEDLAEQTFTRHKISFDCSEVNELEIPDESLRIMIYQVVRELFNNIVEHSGAGRVELMLFTDKDVASVMVSDNGKGFDSNMAHKQSSQKNRFGLFSICERVEYLDGWVDIQSSPENGTSITVHIPLVKTDKSDV